MVKKYLLICFSWVIINDVSDNRTEYIKSIQFLSKWLLLALVAGSLGILTVRGFVFFLDLVRQGIGSVSLPQPVWTILGALFVSLIIYRLSPEAAGEGIPSYINSLRINIGVLDFKETFFKFWAALFTIATYGNGGVLGPVGRVTAGIMSQIVQKMTGRMLHQTDIRTATTCGLAAAIGAIYHSPLGGGIFAIEIIQKADMKYKDLFPAIMSSAIATFLSKSMGFGTFYQFQTNDGFMEPGIVPILLLLAVLIGFLGRIYNSTYSFISRKLRRQAGTHIVIKAVIGSAIVGILCFALNPALLGTSNDLIMGIISGGRGVYGSIPETIPFIAVCFILLVTKMLANCITVGTGLSAGFTGPMTIVGMLFTMGVAHIFDIPFFSSSYYSLMAAGFAGILASGMNVPIAAAVIATEIFGLNYGVPAVIASIIGFQVNRHNTIYDNFVKNYAE